MVDIEQLRCGAKIRYVAWSGTELEQQAEGTIIKVSGHTKNVGSALSNPFCYVRDHNGDGVAVSTWDIVEILDQNNNIPFADEHGGVFHQSPDVVTRFFNSLLGV